MIVSTQASNVLVIGKSGSGKTTICLQTIEESLKLGFEVYILYNKVSKNDMLSLCQRLFERVGKEYADKVITSYDFNSIKGLMEKNGDKKLLVLDSIFEKEVISEVVDYSRFQPNIKLLVTESRLRHEGLYIFDLVVSIEKNENKKFGGLVRPHVQSHTLFTLKDRYSNYDKNGLKLDILKDGYFHHHIEVPNIKWQEFKFKVRVYILKFKNYVKTLFSK